MTHEIETEPEHTKHEESKNTTNRCRLDKPRINYLMRDVDLSEVHWWVSGSGWDSSISAKSRRCWHTSVLTCRHRHQHRDTPTTHPAHLLYGDGALADRVEGLRVVVILKVGRVVVGLGAAVILKIFVGQ